MTTAGRPGALAPATTTIASGGTRLPAGTVVPARVVTWTVGAWQPAGRLIGGTAAVETTLLQPDNGGPAIGAARLDTGRLRLVLYAGMTDPGGQWTNQGAVPLSRVPTVVATFNSGFKFNQSRGGFYADGRASPALRAGAASLVIYADGSATVGQWGRDVSLTPDVVAVRQNLELLVDAGRPASNIASGNLQVAWGFMLNGKVVNWRSAVGVDGAGQLLYVAGPGLDPAGLAGALIAAGAVRAMELDVNPAWVSFDTFTGGESGLPSLVGSKLLPSMNFPAERYLSPGPRDFFAAFSR